jgi:hypothetical protein
MNGQSANYLIDFCIYTDTLLNGVLPMKLYQNQMGAFILNLDFEFEKRGGTHFIAIVKTLDDKYKDIIYYFDSYGFICPPEFKEIIGHTNLLYNNIDFQKLMEKDCGVWCCIFLKLMGLFKKVSSKDFNNVCEYMKDIKINWKEK